MGYYQQQPQGYGPPQPQYGPPQGYYPQQPQPIYIQQQAPQSNDDGYCCGICAALSCCLCLDCLF